MKLGSSRGTDTRRPRGSERSKPRHKLRLTRPSQRPYPGPPERAQPGVSEPCRTTMRRRDEPHREAERLQLPPPVMRRGTGLHRHDAPRKRVEKLQKRSAIDRASNDNLTRRIDRVNTKDPLGQIEPDARDTRCIDDRLAHGRPPSRWRLQQSPSWHA